MFVMLGESIELIAALDRCPPAPSAVDRELDPSRTAAWAATETPGLGTVAALTDLDLTALDRGRVIDVAVGLERAIGWLQAVQQQALARLDVSLEELDFPVAEALAHFDASRALAAVDAAYEEAVTDIRCALRLSRTAAAARLDLATALTGLLAPTLGLMEAGQITLGHARVLHAAVVDCPPEKVTRVQDMVLPGAGKQTPGELARSARRAVLTVNPQRCEQRHAAAVERRHVTRISVEDGMAEILALLPADTAQAFMLALDTVAGDWTPTDGRSADQRRADAMADLAGEVLAGALLTGRTSTGPASTGPTSTGPTGTATTGVGRRHGHRPAIQVTVALSTLLGDDQQPADLDGHGPIPASLARKIAANPDSTWRRLVIDPLGQLLDYGRSTYRPPQDLTDLVLARDRECLFPTCHQPAAKADLDHHVEWQDGGTTSEHNLGPMCGPHHDAKTKKTWLMTREPHGVTRWTNPTTGHTYTNRPQPLPIPTIDPPPEEPPF